MRSMAEFFEEEPGKVKTNEENLNEAHDKEKEVKSLSFLNALLHFL